MAPEFGINCPVNWLISVVLPAPLGPMMACSSPGATSSERLSVALMPPKLRTRFSTRSRGSGKGSATAQPPQQAHDAAAPEQHHYHEFAGTRPVHAGRADEVGVVRQQRAGEAADGARDDEADQTIAVGMIADRLHALLVGTNALHHHA